jgi:hypothetical protein
MKRSIMRVAFLISDFSCDPDEITAALTVDPSEIYRRGQQMGKGPRRVDSPVWRLQSPRESLSLDEHLDWLLDALPADLSALRSCTGWWISQVAAAVHIIGSQGVGIAVTEAQVERMAKLGASLDVDIYCRD